MKTTELGSAVKTGGAALHCGLWEELRLSPNCIIKGKATLVPVGCSKTYAIVAFMQVNLEEKGALAKPVEIIRTNYNGRYEIHHHQGDNVPGPNL
ncbi:60S ribosomal protein L7a [Sciurus carolinensis]|uniref:60S ribosomal protein L7a n=1 Tax=Sciurus carolinensis TaxID=30640 RepID=A0AA41SPY5_SCICA|nr:60S ribosomal protein L7a [Sciurus carolinensis]